MVDRRRIDEMINFFQLMGCCKPSVITRTSCCWKIEVYFILLLEMEAIKQWVNICSNTFFATREQRSTEIGNVSLIEHRRSGKVTQSKTWNLHHDCKEKIELICRQHRWHSHFFVNNQEVADKFYNCYLDAIFFWMKCFILWLTDESKPRIGHVQQYLLIQLIHGLTN